MKSLLSVSALMCLAACNSLLGVQDLSGGEDRSDAGTDVDGADAGVDGAVGPTTTMRFFLVTPDIFALDADGAVQIYADGTKLTDAVYGRLTLPIDIPLSLDDIELRTTEGTVLGVAPVTVDEGPVEGERLIGVVVGNVSQDDVTAPDHVKVAAFSEVLFPGGNTAYVKPVHAITDRDEVMSFVITYPGQAGSPHQVGTLGMAQYLQEVPAAAELRVRFGQSVTASPGTEESSFTLAVASGAKVLLVAGGRQHDADLSRDPGLALYMVPFDGPETRVRPDPAFFVGNFLVDANNENIALTDAATGEQLSGASDVRSEPMLAFLPPDQATAVEINDLSTPYSFSLPARPAGSRTFIALTGFMSPASGQPGVGHIFVDLEASDSASETNVAFVHASPDPTQITAYCRNLSNSADYPFGSLSFGSVGDTMIPTNIAAQFRIFAPGGSTPLRTFTSELEGRRQITVLSGVETGSSETLRATNIDMRSWPWAFNSPVVGQ